jgi:hypothetical protein
LKPDLTLTLKDAEANSVYFKSEINRLLSMAQIEGGPRFRKETDTTISVWFPRNATNLENNQLRYMLDKIIQSPEAFNVQFYFRLWSCQLKATRFES